MATVNPAAPGPDAPDLTLTASRLRTVDIVFGDPRDNDPVPGILLMTDGADAATWMGRFAARHGLPTQPGATQVADDETLYAHVPARGDVRLVHGLEERRLDSVDGLWRALALARQHVYLVLGFLPCPVRGDGLVEHLNRLRDTGSAVLVAVDLGR